MTLLSERYRVDDAVYGDEAVAVHRGHDQVLNRGVTIEILKPGPGEAAAAVALRDKARRMALTELPNVAALYDQGEENSRPFLVFEELLGSSLAEIAPLGPDDLGALVAALHATMRAAQSAQVPLPQLDGGSVRFAEGRTQIVDWAITAGREPATDDPAAVAPLLALGATGSSTGEGGRAAPAPIMRVVRRALAGEYASTTALADELRAAVAAADDPTVAVPRARPTVVLPREEVRRAAAPLSPGRASRQPTPRPPEFVRSAGRRRWLFPVGAAVLLLLGLLAGAAWLQTGSSTTGAATTPGVGETQGVRQPAASATGQGKPYVVATRDGRRLNVRTGPGTGSPVVAAVTNGTVVQVVEGPVPGGGFNWVHIQSNGVDGWAVLEALRQQ